MPRPESPRLPPTWLGRLPKADMPRTITGRASTGVGSEPPPPPAMDARRLCIEPTWPSMLIELRRATRCVRGAYGEAASDEGSEHE